MLTFQFILLPVSLQCICGVYRAHILQAVSGSKSNGKITSFEEYEIFRDVSHSGRNDPVPSTAIPSLEDIVSFFREVFVKSQMEADCIIMSLIYVERLIKETNGGVQPHPTNWHSVLFSCMILASKGMFISLSFSEGLPMRNYSLMIGIATSPSI